MRSALAPLLERARAQPALFRVLWPARENPHFNRRVVRPGDDLVIEGFPRSANSFVLAVFRTTQRPNLKIANHFHSPAQFRLARRYGVPALLLIRAPRESVLSAMIYEETEDPTPLLRRYVRFHEPLIPLCDDLVVADFTTATRDVGRIIAALNARYGTGFAAVRHDDELAARSRGWLRASDERRIRHAGARVGDRRVALPDARRDDRKAALARAFEAREVVDPMAAAEAMYRRLRAAAIT